MTERHITWENFERDFVAPGVPAAHPVLGAPEVRAVFRARPARVGLEIAIPVALALPPLGFCEIEVDVESTARGPQLVVWTANPDIFRPFFSVLLEIADAVQLEAVPPLDAVRLAVERFAHVIDRDTLMAVERRVGLWGELWVLDRLLAARGPEAVATWTGFHRDRHDFRFAGRELEVKTTLSTEPEHLINGAWQLAPSDSHELHLVSLQVERSANGATLDERLSVIEGRLSPGSEARARFDDALRVLSIDRASLRRDPDRFVLRRPPWVVPVAPPLPVLTSATLGAILGEEAALRLGELHYGVNVGGLGHAPGTPLFESVLPGIVGHAAAT